MLHLIVNKMAARIPVQVRVTASPGRPLSSTGLSGAVNATGATNVALLETTICPPEGGVGRIDSGTQVCTRGGFRV